MARFQVLGPVGVSAAGRSIHAGHPRQRTVLAALLVDAGRLVTTEVLTGRVWGDEPPNRARAGLHAHITRVRRLLEQATGQEGPPAPLVRHPGGYLLDIDRDRVDLHRFRSLVARSRVAGAERLATLREALTLWQGEPLAGLPGEWAVRAREAWHQQHHDALVAWAAAELELGDPGAVVEPLSAVLHDSPLLEPVAAALIRALNATGRQAEALDRYARTRRRLVAELGAEPGQELRLAHQEVLRGTPEQLPAPPLRRAPAPDQLPLDVYGFVGRAGALAELDNIITRAADQPTAVIISAISGTAGIGKTTLAVHWAHGARDRFPDGRLYVNLRGFDPDRPPTSPGEALRRFLDALGMPAEWGPKDLDGQVDLYRRQVAGKRILIVLDNARDAEQVRPLLPGAAGCLVLVTSRDQLTSLVATEGARTLALDLLTPDEATAMIARRLGPDRVAAEPEAVGRIIDRCARLPLALAIVAARGTTRPALPLADLAAELERADPGLTAFDAGDAPGSLRTVLSSSYRALSPAAARLLRLLGLHPGPDLGALAAASLAALPPEGVRPLLGELLRANLLTEHTPGRYSHHDLLRAYAAGLVRTEESEENRRAAMHRLLDHYLHTSFAAERILHPLRDFVGLAEPVPGVTTGPVIDRAEALAWWDVERSVLGSMPEAAARAGFDAHAWRLAWAVASLFDTRGDGSEWRASQSVGLAAATRAGDLLGQAECHRGLAGALMRLGRPDEAEENLRAALAAYGELGDITGQAQVHANLAMVAQGRGDQRAALALNERALGLYLAGGNRAGEGYVLNAIAGSYAQLGDLHRAVGYCEQALAVTREVGNRYQEASALHNLGHLRHQLGDHLAAIELYERAAEARAEVGADFARAEILLAQGEAYVTVGDPAAAVASWRRALDVLAGIGRADHPVAAGIRARLSDLQATRPPGSARRAELQPDPRPAQLA